MRYTYIISIISLCFAVGLAGAGNVIEARAIDFSDPDECDLMELWMLESELGFSSQPHDKMIIRIVPEEIHIRKACLILKVMKKLKRVESTPPSTLEEARVFLLNHKSFSELPASCFEYNGVYFFSTRVGKNSKNTYYAGYAVSSKEPLIYKWSVSDIVQFARKKKSEKERGHPL